MPAHTSEQIEEGRRKRTPLCWQASIRIHRTQAVLQVAHAKKAPAVNFPGQSSIFGLHFALPSGAGMR